MALSHQDITEIQQLEALYGHAVDSADASLLARVFARDAVFDFRPTGAGTVCTGLAEIQALFAGPGHPKQHMMTNVFVDEDGGEVRVRSKWLVRNPRFNAIYMGEYEDLMERTAEGWRISRRVCTARDPESFVDPPPALETAD